MPVKEKPSSNKICAGCGAHFIGHRGSRYCPECRAEREAEKSSAHECRICGKTIFGMQEICPACREKRKSSPDTVCIDCGKRMSTSLIKAGALRCPDCAAIAKGKKPKEKPQSEWYCRVCGKPMKRAGFVCAECKAKRKAEGDMTCVLCGGRTANAARSLCPECAAERRRERAKEERAEFATYTAPEPKHQPKPKFSLQDMLFFTDYYSKKFGERISYGKLQVMIDRGEVHPERIRRGKDAVCVPRVRKAL